MTPSLRPHAEQITEHHLFYEADAYRRAGARGRRVRLLGAFIIPTAGARHDILHDRMRPLPPPSPPVLDTIYEAGLVEPSGRPLARVGGIIGRLSIEAHTEPSYEQSDQLLEVVLHLAAQKAILEA